MKRVDPYLSAKALGLSEKDKNILIALADDLVNERLPAEDWQMTCWSKCICGNMEKRGSSLNGPFGTDKPYRPLFTGYTSAMKPTRPCWTVSQKEAGQASYNYLTLGEPRWEEVLNG